MSDAISYRIMKEMARFAKNAAQITFADSSRPDWFVCQFADGSQIKIKYKCAEVNHE